MWRKSSAPCIARIANCGTSSDSFFEHHPNPYIAVFQDLAASPNAQCVPICPIWPEVFKELTDTAQAVSLEPIDPPSRVKLAQQRMQGEYDRFDDVAGARGNWESTERIA